MTRRIGAVVLILCIAVLTAHAQQVNPGTVTWATGYPKAINAVPPNPNGAIEAYGDYTVNQGFSITGVVVYYAPQGSGVPVGTAMTPNNGKWGALDSNNKIVPKTISVPKGTWNVWVTATYFEVATQKTYGVVGDFILVQIN